MSGRFNSYGPASHRPWHSSSFIHIVLTASQRRQVQAKADTFNDETQRRDFIYAVDAYLIRGRNTPTDKAVTQAITLALHEVGAEGGNTYKLRQIFDHEDEQHLWWFWIVTAFDGQERVLGPYATFEHAHVAQMADMGGSP